MQVSGDQHWLNLAALEQLGQLSTGRRLTSTLQTAHHDDVYVGIKLNSFDAFPEQVDQLLVDDPNQLFARFKRKQYFFAEGLFGNATHKVTHHVETDIRFQQRLLDQLEPVTHVRFR